MFIIPGPSYAYDWLWQWYKHDKWFTLCKIILQKSWYIVVPLHRLIKCINNANHVAHLISTKTHYNFYSTLNQSDAMDTFIHSFQNSWCYVVGQVLVKEFHTYTINCTSYTKVRIFVNCNKNADGQHVCRISWYIIVSLHQVMDRSHTSYHTPDVNQFSIRTSIVHCLGARLGTVSLTTFRLL